MVFTSNFLLNSLISVVKVHTFRLFLLTKELSRWTTNFPKLSSHRHTTASSAVATCWYMATFATAPRTDKKLWPLLTLHGSTTVIVCITLLTTLVTSRGYCIKDRSRRWVFKSFGIRCLVFNSVGISRFGPPRNITCIYAFRRLGRAHIFSLTGTEHARSGTAVRLAVVRITRVFAVFLRKTRVHLIIRANTLTIFHGRLLCSQALHWTELKVILHTGKLST